MTDLPPASFELVDPVCTAEARYWRSGLRWQIVLQIMYYTDHRQGRGQGPFFVIGHAWSEETARAMAEETNGRLARSRLVIQQATADYQRFVDERRRS